MIKSIAILSTGFIASIFMAYLMEEAATRAIHDTGPAYVAAKLQP